MVGWKAWSGLGDRISPEHFRTSLTGWVDLIGCLHTKMVSRQSTNWAIRRVASPLSQTASNQMMSVVIASVHDKCLMLCSNGRMKDCSCRHPAMKLQSCLMSPFHRFINIIIIIVIFLLLLFFVILIIAGCTLWNFQLYMYKEVLHFFMQTSQYFPFANLIPFSELHLEENWKFAANLRHNCDFGRTKVSFWMTYFLCPWWYCNKTLCSM